MISVEVTGADALSAKLGGLPLMVRAALRTKAADLAQRLQAHVVQNKLSGQVLHVKSGALRASIGSEITVDGDKFRARVFSSGDLKYAAIQEFGGHTPPHDIFPDKAKVLAFVVGGEQRFATVVHHPGSQIPARSYLRSALADMAGRITGELKSAAITAAMGAFR